MPIPHPRAAPTAPAPPPLALKSTDGLVEGYASLFHAPDLGGDAVVPGAFRRSLAVRGAAGIRMLFQHDPAEPIGTWESIAEDARGLHVRGRLASGVQRASELLALLRVGAVDGLSIGFRTVRARRDPAHGVRLLEQIDLWEISIVTFPLHPAARVSAIKSRAPTASGSEALSTLRSLTAHIRRSARASGPDPVPHAECS